MDETNKMLSMLLVVGIVVSLIGLTTSLNKIGQLGLDGLTGRATDVDNSGLVQLNVTSDTSIAFTKTSIDFGNGRVNTSCDNCTMWTNSSTGASSSHVNASCCALSWGTIASSGTAQSGLWVQNLGNTNLSVYMNITGSAANFIGGPSPHFQFITEQDSNAKDCVPVSSCTLASYNDNTAACTDGGGLNYTTAWTEISANTSYTLCGSYGFKPISTQDEFIIDVRVTVPRDAIPSQKTTTVILTGTSA